MGATDPLYPFLKWPGGKRWLTSHSDLFPPDYKTYYEPFLGGGSVFFSLNPDNAVLSDINCSLISCYKILRNNWRELHQKLAEMQELHSVDYFYKIRKDTKGTSLNRAARFLYLNRTCFNGLYRENRLGEFNVPVGTKTTVLLSTDNFAESSRRLRRAELVACDFEVTLKKVQKEDFVFIDRPYTVAHNQNGFIKYNDSMFSWQDQQRLMRCVEDLRDKGAYVLISNANHESIRDLYRGIGKMRSVSRPSLLAGKKSARKATSELMICINYNQS